MAIKSSIINNQSSPFYKKSKLIKWLVIIRANFLLATFIPLIFGCIWSLQFTTIATLRLDLLFMLLIGTVSCHIAANTFNDYFDWQSGNDQINTNYILSISGGSRSIEFGLITEKSMFWLAVIFSIIAMASALYICIIKGPIILLLSAIGGFAIYFYVAPPICLAARRGLGEFFIFLCFGPVLVFGVIYVLTNKLDLVSCYIGIPIGILITSCLITNEYPDLAADTTTGKNNLAVTMGAKMLPWCITLLTILAYIITIFGIMFHIFPKTFFISTLTVPLAIYEIILVFKLQKHRQYIYKACINNLKLYTGFGLSFIIASALTAYL